MVNFEIDPKSRSKLIVPQTNAGWQVYTLPRYPDVQKSNINHTLFLFSVLKKTFGKLFLGPQWKSTRCDRKKCNSKWIKIVHGIRINRAKWTAKKWFNKNKHSENFCVYTRLNANRSKHDKYLPLPQSAFSWYRFNFEAIIHMQSFNKNIQHYSLVLFCLCSYKYLLLHSVASVLMHE